MAKDNTRSYIFYPLQILSRDYKWELDKFLPYTSINHIRSNIYETNHNGEKILYSIITDKPYWEDEDGNVIPEEIKPDGIIFGRLLRLRMRIAIKKADYRKLIDTDVGLKILPLYTIYNITSGDKEYVPLNLVMGIYDFKYSMEEFALFVGEVEKPGGLTASIKLNLSELGNQQYMLSSKVMPTPMDISMELAASKEIKKNGEIAISLIKPEIIIRLITAYAITSNDSLRRVLESSDLFDSIINYYNKLGISKFDDYGALIPGNISSYLLEGLN